MKLSTENTKVDHPPKVVITGDEVHRACCYPMERYKKPIPLPVRTAPPPTGVLSGVTTCKGGPGTLAATLATSPTPHHTTDNTGPKTVCDGAREVR